MLGRRYLRYTTDGFQQDKLIELGLNRNHSYVLRWFIDFQATGQMREHLVEGIAYYWVSYGTILEDLPILGIQKRQLANILKDMVNAGVLKHFHLKQGGSFSFYTTGDAYASLIYDPMQSIADPLCNLLQTPMKLIADPYVIDYIPLCNELTNKDYPIKDTSIKKQKNALQPNVLFDEFWKLYPKKVAKQKAIKAYQGALKKASHETIITGLQNYKTEIIRKQIKMDFVKHPTGWLNDSRWEDDYDSTTTTPSTNAYDALLAKIKSVMDQDGNFEHNASPCNIHNIKKFISCEDSIVKVYYRDERELINPKHFTIEKITKIGVYC